MQKIFFKKRIDLNHQLKELLSISVDESINYKTESQGIRAYGSIIINGEYNDEHCKKSFYETIDLDILAQYSKINDKNEFNIKVEDFDYSMCEGNLLLTIQACIYGVLDDEDRYVETDVKSIENEVTIDEEIEELIRSQDQIIENSPADEKEMKVVAPPSQQVVENKVIEEEKVEEKREEDDDDDLGAYYLYVVKEGDTYQTIAGHYQVDEYKLKSYNHERTLSKGEIVIIPYYV